MNNKLRQQIQSERAAGIAAVQRLQSENAALVAFVKKTCGFSDVVISRSPTTGEIYVSGTNPTSGSILFSRG